MIKSKESYILYIKYIYKMSTAISNDNSEVINSTQVVDDIIQMRNPYKRKEKHVMVDLETLGVKSGCVIVSIGAVEFDFVNGATSKTFYERIDIQSCLDVGLFVQGETLVWWLQQPDAARLEICKDSKPLQEVLKLFGNFLRHVDNDLKNIQIWGNGSSFDLGILATAYSVCTKPTPWMFWNERDVRTLVYLNPDVKKNTPSTGTLHNPVDDCLHQIKYCVVIVREIKRLQEIERVKKLLEEVKFERINND